MRSGLTLVELIGGLAVGGLVLAVALRMFVMLSTSVARVDGATLRSEQYRNGVRWLAERLRETAEPNDAQPFIGLATSLSFRVKRTNDGVRYEGDDIEIRVDSLSRWVARRQATQLVLHPNVSSISIEYLGSHGLDSRWQQSWISTATRPMAVRIRVGSSRLQGATVDTLLFVVGVQL